MITKRLTLLLILFGVLGYGSQSYAKAVSLPTAELFGLPDTIAGYQVVAVETSDTISCMPSGTKNLILRSTRPSLDEFFSSNDSRLIDTALKDLSGNEPDKLNYQIIGAGVTLDDIAKIFHDWDPKQRLGPCVKLSPHGSDMFHPALDIYSTKPAGFNYFQDTDAGNNWTDDNAQSVHIIGPQLIGQLAVNDAIAILNNVWTDGNAFYQSGILAVNLGSGTMIASVYAYKAHQTDQPYAQSLALSVTPGHPLMYTVTYTNGLWWMCGEDLNVPNHLSYVCQHDNHTSVGTHLVSTIDTSVWLELQTTNGNWYQAFNGNDFYVESAKIYRMGIAQNWATENLNHDGCINHYGAQPPNPLRGSLIGGGTGSFKISQATLQCP